MRGTVFLWTVLLVIGLVGEAVAQQKLFAVSGQGRGGQADARQAAQIDQLRNSQETLATAIDTCAGKGMVYGPSVGGADAEGCVHAQSPCGDLGMLYGPSHPNADANGCIAAADACGDLGMILGPGHSMADGSGCVAGLMVAPTGVAQATNGLQLGDQATCDVTHEGVLRYNSAVKTVLFCDGQFWQEIGAAPETSTTFNDVSDAEPGQTYTTGQATVSGFFGERTVTASNGALILVNGGLQGASATVVAGDRIQLRMDASSSFSAAKTTTMSMGSLVTNWTITTRAQDTTPNSFSFTDLTNQETDTLVTSNSVTVSGFDGPLTASISGQGGVQLRVGAGSWSNSAVVDPGQSIQLRMTTAASAGVTHGATVVLGSVTVGWNVKTGSPIPSNLSLTHTSNSRSVQVSWKAGANINNCVIQNFDGNNWRTIQTVNCNSDFSGTVSLGIVGADWGGSQIRLAADGGGQPLASFPDTLDCAPGSYSSSPTPNVDEDCNGVWDNSTSETLSGCDPTRQCQILYSYENSDCSGAQTGSLGPSCTRAALNQCSSSMIRRAASGCTHSGNYKYY